MSYSISYWSLLGITFLFLVDTAWLLYKKKNILEYIPSIIWCFLCSAPLLLLAKEFEKDIVSVQLTGVLIFQVALWLSDKLSLSQKLNNSRSTTPIKFPAWILISFCMVVWTYHIYKMPSVPLIQKYIYGVKDPLHLAILRENSSKLLELPLGMIYIIQSTLTFFAPVALVFLLQKKKWIFASTFLFLSLIYSRITLAKGPLFLYLAVTGTLLFFSWLRYQLWYQSAKKYILIFILIFGIYALQFLAFNQKSLFNLTPPPSLITEIEQKFTDEKTSPLKISRVDFYRIYRADEIYEGMNAFEKAINFYTYRALFVPIEVSYYWYFYFTKNEPKIGFYGLSPSTRNNQAFDHPAGRVGRWAYWSRFPEQYERTIRAYCSADADAYARFGLLGLLIISAFLVALRLGLKLVKTEGRTEDGLYYATLLIAGLYLPVSSLFSLAISSGIYFYILFQIVLKLLKNKKQVIG